VCVCECCVCLSVCLPSYVCPPAHRNAALRGEIDHLENLIDEHRSDQEKLVSDSDYKLALMNQVRPASRDESVCVSGREKGEEEKW
jgi:hypothetical protein